MIILRRRKFIINKPLQFRLLLISLSYLVLFFIVMATLLFAPLMIEMERSGQASENALQAANQILYLHSYFWPVGLLTLAVIGLHSIRTSHKVAGPFYRLNLVFKAMKEGTLPRPIQTRKSDYLLTEIETVNQVLDIFRSNMQEIKKAQAHLNRAILECNKVASHASKEQIVERIDDITRRENQLEDKINYFKIES